MRRFSKKQAVSALTAALLLLLPTAGCSEKADIASDKPQNAAEESENIESAENTAPTDGKNESTESGSHDAREDYFAALPSADYGGREFVIAATDPQFVGSEEQSGIIGGYLYNRNRAIEEKFNIKITVKTVSEAEVQTGLMAQTDDAPFADLLYAPMEESARCAGQNLLMNLYSVPFFDYDAPYCEPETQKNLTVADTAYSIYGDAAFDQRAAWCVFYNKDLLSAAGFSPEKTVSEGTWTWDELLTESESVRADLNENGRMTADTDRFGYSAAMNTTALCRAAFATFGKHYFARDNDGLYAMDFDITEDDDYVSILRRLCVTEPTLFPMRNPGSAAYDAFSENRLAFFMGPLSYASTLAYSEINWGILPMPNRFADTEYKSLVDPMTACGYSVPYGVRDSDLCGRVLTALYAYEASHGAEIVQNAWIYYYLRDNTSAAMLTPILQNRVYDIAYTCGEGYPDFAIASYELLSSVMENNVRFSTLYAQNKETFGAFMLKEFVH